MPTEEGAKLYWVRLGLLGIQRAFDLSGPLLRGSWSAVRAWVQLQPSKPRTPMTLFVLECVLLALLGRGNSLKGKDRLEWWSAMLATWISFEGLLRPGEADFLVAGDLLFPEDTEMAQGVSLIVGIRRAKTRRTWALQHALINNAQLVRWLRWWAADFPRKRKLFPVARRKWANYFREVVLQLGLQSCEFTLGSLRAGGATHQFRVHRNLGALQYAGRWKRAETLKHYLQRGTGGPGGRSSTVGSESLIARDTFVCASPATPSVSTASFVARRSLAWTGSQALFVS